MATLQKFKLLATQCAIAGSPTRSPATSPVINLRRRKTLRMLLRRTGGGSGRKPTHRSGEGTPDRNWNADERNSPEKSRELSVSRKLKDLFVSSPPAFKERLSENVLINPARGGGNRLMRPMSATFRQRLLRRAWRPVLVAIPE